MEVHIYSVQDKSQTGNMSQTYNDNIKRLKPQDTQLGILKIYAFCWKIQQNELGPGESTAGVTQYLSLTIHCLSQNSVVLGRVQLEHSSHIVKIGVIATC